MRYEFRFYQFRLVVILNAHKDTYIKKFGFFRFRYANQMADTKDKVETRMFNEMKQRRWKPDPRHPPYEDVMKGAFHDKKHELGFPREAILKYIYLQSMDLLIRSQHC